MAHKADARKQEIPEEEEYCGTRCGCDLDQMRPQEAASGSDMIMRDAVDKLLEREADGHVVPAEFNQAVH